MPDDPEKVVELATKLLTPLLARNSVILNEYRPMS